MWDTVCYNGYLMYHSTKSFEGDGKLETTVKSYPIARHQEYHKVLMQLFLLRKAEDYLIFRNALR